MEIDNFIKIQKQKEEDMVKITRKIEILNAKLKEKNKKENNNDIKSTNNRIKDLRKIINIYYKNDKQDENKNKIEFGSE